MSSGRYLSPAEAAQQLKVSVKALRVYEEHGLIVPGRTAAGWRVYGETQMARATEVITLRSLGLSLARISRVLDGDREKLHETLTAHEAVLEERISELVVTIARLRELKFELSCGDTLDVGKIAGVLRTESEIRAAFALPWPWGGEHFEICSTCTLTYIVGPLGSGKTRLAQCLAGVLPDAEFAGAERRVDGYAKARALLETDLVLRARVDRAIEWLVEDGATVSDALIAILVKLESERPIILIVDMIEQGLDQNTQQALIAHLRHRKSQRRALFLLTRSSAILDLASIGPSEAIIFCPANHSPPIWVAPYPGSPGYEAVATCLATPEVRARTEGMIAWRPKVAQPAWT